MLGLGWAYTWREKVLGLGWAYALREVFIGSCVGMEGSLFSWGGG